MTREDLEHLANSINDAVVQISYRWKIFCQLFDSGAESIEAMNRRGANVFQLLQKLIIDDATLSLARLTDKGNMGGNVNASLPYLLRKSAPYLDDDEYKSYSDLINRLAGNVSAIRSHRNKALAHADLGVVMKPGELPPLTYGELENAMELCRHIVSNLTATLFGWSTHYDVQIPYGSDGETLIKVLKFGNRALDEGAA